MTKLRKLTLDSGSAVKVVNDSGMRLVMGREHFREAVSSWIRDTEIMSTAPDDIAIEISEGGDWDSGSLLPAGRIRVHAGEWRIYSFDGRLCARLTSAQMRAIVDATPDLWTSDAEKQA